MHDTSERVTIRGNQRIRSASITGRKGDHRNVGHLRRVAEGWGYNKRNQEMERSRGEEAEAVQGIAKGENRKNEKARSRR